MINNQMKLLFSAFIVILLGIVLIQPIGDDIELAKIGSRSISNESVALSVTTATIPNETVALSDAPPNTTGTLANNYLTILTALSNITGPANLLGFCNVTLRTGFLSCNDTGNATAYAEYTFNDYSTGRLTNDELISVSDCRNSTMNSSLIGTHCNVTLPGGAVTVVYDNFTDNLAYVDYIYTPDTYVHSSAARTLLTVTVLFFAIGILAVGIGFAWKALKEGGIIE